MCYKKFFYGLIFVASVIACSTVEQDFKDDVLISKGQQEVVITATMESQPETRTVLGDDYLSVLWKPEDEIKVFSAGEASKFTSQNTENEKAVNFKGVISVITGTAEGTSIDTHIYGLYPYTEEATMTGGSFTTELPSVQTGLHDSFDDDLFISIGRSYTFSMGFWNVCSGYRFSFTEDGYQSVTLSSNDGTPLAGMFVVTFDENGKPVITSHPAPSSSVTVNAPDGGFVANTWYYIVVLPGTHEEGYTFTATNASGTGTYVVTDPNKKTFNRSRFRQIAGLDERLEFPEDDNATPLSLQATANGIISVTNPKNLLIQYQINNGEWIGFSSDAEISVSADDVVSFRGDNPTYCVYESNEYLRTVIGSTVPCYVYGNIMSLIDSDDYEQLKTLTGKYALAFLFESNRNLNNHPTRELILPATTLSEFCYYCLFFDCESLTRTPELPATELALSCYGQMFSHCSSLASAPVLPATELAVGCYYAMFRNTALTSAPVLPATVLAVSCYSHMFDGCSSLETAPALNALTLAETCYSSMFANCTSLTEVPDLPATKIDLWSYNDMFEGCTQLSSAVILPATENALSTSDFGMEYQNMFYGCPNLESVTIYAPTIVDESIGYFGDWPIYVTQDVLAKYQKNNSWSSFIQRVYSIDAKGIEPVDLGLSVKWAPFNIGGSETSLGTSFESVYTNTTDVVKTIWGGKWRTPTNAEWEELANNCYWTGYNVRLSDYNYIPAYHVTGGNGNCINLLAVRDYDPDDDIMNIYQFFTATTTVYFSCKEDGHPADFRIGYVYYGDSRARAVMDY